MGLPQASLHGLVVAAIVLMLGGCATPYQGTVVDVSRYLVSRDSDLEAPLQEGGSQTITCSGGKNVHMVVLANAGALSERSQWRVLVGERTALAIEVNALETSLQVFACLAPGEVVSRLRYERGSELLATAVVDIEPMTTS